MLPHKAAKKPPRWAVGRASSLDGLTASNFVCLPETMKDIDDIRRENLCLIEETVGGLTAAAMLVGMSPSQFANLRDGAKDSKTGKPRGMRKDTARRIEAAAGHPQGWLDIDHGGSSGAAGNATNAAQENIQQAALVAAYQRADAGTREVVDALLSRTPAAWLEPMMALALQGMKQAAVQWIEDRKKIDTQEKTGT